jgi:hypothetical protein
MKSVPNLISYLHEFFQNFSQSPAIYFELISFGVIFNSEITDERAPPVRRRAPCRRRGLKPLSGLCAARPDSSPRPRRCRLNSALALAARPTASPRSPRPRRRPVRSRPSLSERHGCRCPAASAVASTTTVSVARALVSPFFVRGASSSPFPPSSPS